MLQTLQVVQMLLHKVIKGKQPTATRRNALTSKIVVFFNILYCINVELVILRLTISSHFPPTWPLIGTLSKHEQGPSMGGKQDKPPERLVRFNFHF
jgi:hypothetical protein